MRDFIDYLQEAFITSSGGNTYDNSYSNLDLTARSLLGFQTPTGSRITLSSFVRPKFGTSYSIGIKDGWISYLFSSLPPLPPNDNLSSSEHIPLPDLLRCYRPLSTTGIRHTVGHNLVYGRMYLPQSRLEALVASRVTREINLTVRAVSSQQGDLYRPHGGATVLGLASWDDPAGRFGIETLASTDGGVLGLRGLWNATNPPSGDESHIAAATTTTTTTNSTSTTPLDINTNANANANANINTNSHISSAGITTAAVDPSSNDKERINGRFSVGAEIYYGLLNKSGGVSLGGRFQTLPTHHGTPLTATLTFNLLGHVRATYALIAGDCTLATCFGFNLYSYESEWAVGIELWNRRKKRRSPVSPGTTGSGVEEQAESVVGQEGGTAFADRVGEMGANMAFTTPVDETASTVVAVEAEKLRGSTSTSTSTSTSSGSDTVLATTPPSPPPPENRKFRERSFQAKLEWRLDEDDDDIPATTAAATGEQKETEGDFPAGVLKARCDQNMRIGLLYEGRYKALLFSLGTDVDFRKMDAPFQTVGLAVQYSS